MGTDHLVCGFCRVEVAAVLELLFHKAEHAGPKAGICCEFCGTHFTRKKTLVDHYRVKHKINSKAFPKQSRLLEHTPCDRHKTYKKSAQESCLEEKGVAIENERIKVQDKAHTTEVDAEQDKVMKGNTKKSLNEIKMEDTNEENGKSGEVSSNRNHSKTCVKIKAVCRPKIIPKPDTDSVSLTHCKMDCGQQIHGIQCTEINSVRTGSCKEIKQNLNESNHCNIMKDIQNEMVYDVPMLCNNNKNTSNGNQGIVKREVHNNIQHDIDNEQDVYMDEEEHSDQKASRRPRIRKVEKQDMIGHYSCHKCKKEFCRLRYLRKHLLTHKTGQEFLCDECGKHFKTKTYLNAHRKVHNKKAFVCKQCNFTSNNAYAIHSHRQIHSEGSIICEICGFAYSDKSTLIKHKRVHDMSRPLACSYPGCTWRFKNEVACLTHIRGHLNVERKFKCEQCGYAFRHKHHLKRHELKMHGVIRNRGNPDEADLDIQEVPKATHIQEVILGDTVKILVDPDQSHNINIQDALETGGIVIATDSQGNTINYHVADLEISEDCNTVTKEKNNAVQNDAIEEVSERKFVPQVVAEEIQTDFHDDVDLTTALQINISNDSSVTSDLHVIVASSDKKNDSNDQGLSNVVSL